VEESARRSLVAKRNLKKDEKICIEDLDFRRPGDAGISVADGYTLLGKKALVDIPKGSFLQWEMVG